jgi:hypothetical protein
MKSPPWRCFPQNGRKGPRGAEPSWYDGKRAAWRQALARTPGRNMSMISLTRDQAAAPRASAEASLMSLPTAKVPTAEARHHQSTMQFHLTPGHSGVRRPFLFRVTGGLAITLTFAPVTRIGQSPQLVPTALPVLVQPRTQISDGLPATNGGLQSSIVGRDHKLGDRQGPGKPTDPAGRLV